MPDPRHGALAHPAAVRGPRRDARPRRRRLRQRRVPVPAPAGRRRASRRPSGIDPDADPWLPERAVWPLLDVVDERARRALAARPRRAPRRGRRAPTRRRRAGASPPSATSPSCSTATRCTARRWCAPGRAARRRRRRRLLPPTSLAGRALAAPARADRRPEPGRAPRRRLRAAARRAGARSTCPRGCRCSGSPGCPPATSHVLRALAAGRDVHLFLLHPSPALWERDRSAIAARTGRRAAPRTPPPRCRPTACSPPGAGTRARCSSSSAPTATRRPPPPGRRRRRHAARAHPGRRPRRRAPPGPPLPGADDARPARPDDRSIQVHACHGRARQVEVLRDAILHLLADDPTLEPRDVIVMCPDIETFAPLIHATFGAGEVGRRRRARRAARRRPPARPARPPRRPRRCARPTRCSASSRGCSTSPSSG